MKQKLSLLMACLTLLFLCACSQTAAPSQAEKTPLEGYKTYESTTANFVMQYPEKWVEVNDKNIDEHEALGAVIDTLGLTKDEAKSSLEDTDMMLYDIELATEEFVPSLNVVSGSMPGLTQSNLKGEKAAKEFQDALAPMMADAFDSFTLVSDFENKTLGDNLFLAYQMEYELEGMPITAYQLITANDEIMYTFTSSSPQGTLTDAKKAEIETAISTLKFN